MDRWSTQKGALLVVFLVSLAAPQLVLAAKVGVVFDSSPRGATVEIDGRIFGVTPFVLFYPEGFFKAPSTVWNKFLGAQSTVEFKLDGFQSEQLRFGTGPLQWVSLDGTNRFPYYLAHRAYFAVLSPKTSETQKPADPVAVADALEKLGNLRREGLLSEGEFDTQKAKLLGAGAETPSEVPTAASQQGFSLAPEMDAESFCSGLWPKAFQGPKVSKSFKVLSAGPSLVPSSSGPLVSCAWTNPFEGTSFVHVFVQCGIGDVPEACTALPGSVSLNLGIATSCVTKDRGSWVALLPTGCAIRAGVATLGPGDGEELSKEALLSAAQASK
jgi:hypothetical protein